MEVNLFTAMFCIIGKYYKNQQVISPDSHYNHYIQFNLATGGEIVTIREQILNFEQTLMYYRKKDFEGLLADDFCEFGSSGRIYDKEIQLSSVTEYGCNEIQFT